MPSSEDLKESREDLNLQEKGREFQRRIELGKKEDLCASIEDPGMI